jgi:CRISPR-associated protein Cas5d
MKDYEIAIEISGPFAMWSRPDTGARPTSYPVPTWSAAKGILESIAFYKDGKAWIRPTRVEICKPKGCRRGVLNYQQYTTNYHGPLKKKVNFQFSCLILSDVCYRIYAVVKNGSGKHLKNGDNPCHALQGMFLRRLSKGQCYKTPALGWNEFVPTYWGPLRQDETEVDIEISLNMVSVLNQVFDKAVNGQYRLQFKQREFACISNGVFHYAE